MLKKLRIIFLFLVLLAAVLVTSGVHAQTSGAVYVLTIDGTINPVLVDYVDRGIQEAENNGAQAVIIQLDTPGGLDTAMRDIIKLMVNAYVPVVVYVSPSGSRAASAGVFITIAAHVAAMAPDTNIGAAHPVSIGAEGEQTMSDTMEEKVVNDAAAYIRSLAQTHGRNMDWAEQAVRESVSATEQEALDLNVIDLVAANLPDLLNKLDGRQVTMISGQVITLHTANAAVVDFPMTAIENFLYTIADPNIAYLLLSIATLGIMAEIFSPGLIFPGIVGGISLLLAFYALGMLPVNYAGILLIVLAVGLFIGEVLTTSFGIFTAGGIISLVAGSLMLFKGAAPEFQINPWLIAIVCIVVTAGLTFIIQRAISVHRKQAFTGREELIGKTVVVKEELNPKGTIFYKGERWTAISESGEVPVGREVIIKKVDGLVLYVVKKPKKPSGKKSKR
jgi:membrane-bound serine protease (ClpP class)